MDPLVCPLMSLTEPLKPLGDYPKCSHDKCAWWVNNLDSCAIVALAAASCTESPVDALGQIAEATRGIKSAFVPFAFSDTPVGRAIQVFGKIGEFVEEHQPELDSVVGDLTVVLSEMRQRSELRRADRERQQEAAKKGATDDTS